MEFTIQQEFGSEHVPESAYAPVGEIHSMSYVTSPRV